MEQLLKYKKVVEFLPLVLALLTATSILIFLKFLPEKLPLFYSLPWGEAQLANHQQFLIIPALLVLICLINFAVSWQLHQTQSFFKMVLQSASLITAVVLLITFIKIVLIFI